MTINEKQISNNAITGVEYVFSSEIASESAVGSTKTSFTLISGKLWKSIYFTPGSALLTSQVNNPFQGKIIESKFEMKVPGLSESMANELYYICGRAVVVKLIFENGSSMVCGGKTRKLRLTSTSSFGTQNGYLVGFEYRSKDEFLWLQDESSGSGT